MVRPYLGRGRYYHGHRANFCEIRLVRLRGRSRDAKLSQRRSTTAWFCVAISSSGQGANFSLTRRCNGRSLQPLQRVVSDKIDPVSLEQLATEVSLSNWRISRDFHRFHFFARATYNQYCTLRIQNTQTQQPTLTMTTEENMIHTEQDTKKNTVALK